VIICAVEAIGGQLRMRSFGSWWNAMDLITGTP